MWARAEFAARRAARSAVSVIGTRPVSLALLALAGAYAIAVLLWDRFGGADAAWGLAASPAYGLLGAAILVDAGARTWRDLRRAPSTAAAVPVAPTRRGIAASRLALDLSWLLLGAGLLLGFMGRTEVRAWAAAGERLDGRPGQILGRSPDRPLALAPTRLGLTVERIDADGAPGRGGSASARVAVAGRWTAISRLDPAFTGWDSFVRVTGWGLAPRFVIADASGRVLDEALVKLRLSEDGGGDSIGARSVPHRIYLRLDPEAPRTSGAASVALRADAFRGRQPIASGPLAPGGELRFEGLVVRMPEVRRWVELRVVRDPGLPALAAALVTAFAALALRAFDRRRLRERR